MTHAPTPDKRSNAGTQAETSAWSMYRAIVGTGALCAVIIVGVYQVTAERIFKNQQQFLQTAIRQVLPSATSTVGITLRADGTLERSQQNTDLPAFLCYDNNDRLRGAVIAAEGMGYQDLIRVLYAYSFEHKAITGFKVLDSKETPGLGDRVEKEPHFLANFDRLDTRLDAAGNSLLHPIATVKQGEKTDPWQIDGITGATITSEAIGSLLDESARRWVPVLERQAPSFAELTSDEDG